MNTVNLSFHITGPAWSWWLLAGAASLYALASAVSVGVELYRRHALNKAVGAAMAAHTARSAIMGGATSSGYANARKDWTDQRSAQKPWVVTSDQRLMNTYNSTESKA